MTRHLLLAGLLFSSSTALAETADDKPTADESAEAIEVEEAEARRGSRSSGKSRSKPAARSGNSSSRSAAARSSSTSSRPATTRTPSATSRPATSSSSRSSGSCCGSCSSYRSPLLPASSSRGVYLERMQAYARARLR